MLEKLLSWSWGPGKKLGLGAFLGIILVVIPSLLCIGFDLLGITRQVQPPPFLGDFVPEHHQVCKSTAAFLEQIKADTTELNELGWPAWPTGDDIELVDCDPKLHQPAAPGFAVWHLCGELRDDGKGGAPSCPPILGDVPPLGATWADVDSSKNIVAVDMYLHKGVTPKHEQLHGRGLLVTPEEDALTPYVKGAHTEKPGHLMAEHSGDGMKWLDRTADGDWPHSALSEPQEDAEDAEAPSDDAEDAPEAEAPQEPQEPE